MPPLTSAGRFRQIDIRLDSDASDDGIGHKSPVTPRVHDSELQEPHLAIF